MSWPSVIILVSAGQRPSLEGPIRSLELVPDPMTGEERLHQHGYSYYIDVSGGILADYQPDELEHVRTRIGEPYAVYVSCQSMDAARAFLREVLPDVDGLVDTNHHEILQAGEFLMLVDRYPGLDWRRQPSTDLAYTGSRRRECAPNLRGAMRDRFVTRSREVLPPIGRWLGAVVARGLTDM